MTTIDRQRVSRARRGSLVVAGLLASLWLAGRAEAGKAEEAREHLDRAADNYEKAFALKPDPALLYNAAQAHQLAGNKQRALELYQSYLRMYATDKRAEIEKHIENLKQAIEKDWVGATTPPTTAATVGSTIVVVPGPPPPPASAPAGGQPSPLLVTQAAPPQQRGDDGSVLTKPWFWTMLAGAALVGIVGGVLLTRGDPSDPTASIGPPLNGN